jgi:4-amino-4-deoxy-L-arabinose transferase-like glycosyltransferase
MRHKVQLEEKWGRIVCSVNFIVVVALLIRAAFLCYFISSGTQQGGQQNLVFGYEAGDVAAAIAQGRGFSSPLSIVQTGPTAWFTPIYPYILGGIFKVFGVYSFTSSIVIRILDNIFSAATCWPIYAIGAAFSKRIGTAAAWIWVFFPTSLFFSTVWVWDTVLSTLALTVIIAATLKVRGSERLSCWIGYGALWAAGTMINATVLSVLPPLGLWAIWPLRRRFANAARLVVASSLMFTAGIMPWTVRNYVVFHKLIPFRSTFGLELWLGNNPGVTESWSPWLHPDGEPSEAAKYAHMTEIPYMQEKQQEALRFIRNQPVDTLNFTLHRFSDTWLGVDQSPSAVWNFVPLHEKLIILGKCLFAALSLLGTLFAYRDRNQYGLPLALVMFFFPLVFYITSASPRHRHPMDPVMLVLAVYAVGYLVRHFLELFSGLEAGIPASHTTD